MTDWTDKDDGGSVLEISSANKYPANQSESEEGEATAAPTEQAEAEHDGGSVADQAELNAEGEAAPPAEEVSNNVAEEEAIEKVAQSQEGGEQTEDEVAKTAVEEDLSEDKNDGADEKKDEDKKDESEDQTGEAGHVKEEGEEVVDTPGDGEETKEGEGEKVEGEAQKGEEGEKEGEEEGDKAKEGDTQVDESSAVEKDRMSPVPQSDTFTEGELPESGVGVGEKLSREHSPILEEDETRPPDSIAPTTPDRIVTPSDHGGGATMTLYEEDEQMIKKEEEEEEEQQPQFDREQLIEKYHAALVDREQLQTQNYQLQHKLADYFRKKKADERQDYDKNVTDQEQRYLKYIAQLEDLRRQDEHDRHNSMQLIEDLKGRCEEKNQKVDDERTKFVEFRKQVALNAINSRSGKPIPPKDIDQYLSNAIRKEGEVVVVRLENIKLKNKLRKKEQQLKSKEELAEGLHLIDFEQLKIENQTYNEKIEERNEELLKLRKKITSTVQVLTHLKEKLQFVYAENHVQDSKLKDVEALAAQRRDILSRTKQARDSLRIDNQKLRQNCGLLGNEPLLRDFEDRKDEGDDLKVKLDNLRMMHAELTLNCTQVRRKIEQAKHEQP